MEHKYSRNLERDEEIRRVYREEGWGIMAEQHGLDPLNVESAARRAYQFAWNIQQKHVKALWKKREIIRNIQNFLDELPEAAPSVSGNEAGEASPPLTLPGFWKPAWTAPKDGTWLMTKIDGDVNFVKGSKGYIPLITRWNTKEQFWENVEHVEGENPFDFWASLLDLPNLPK